MSTNDLRRRTYLLSLLSMGEILFCGTADKGTAINSSSSIIVDINTVNKYKSDHLFYFQIFVRNDYSFSTTNAYNDSKLIWLSDNYDGVNGIIITGKASSSSYNISVDLEYNSTSGFYVQTSSSSLSYSKCKEYVGVLVMAVPADL